MVAVAACLEQRRELLVGFNWQKKKGCFLLSSYKKIQNKKGWTAGSYTGSSPPSPSTCEETIYKNKRFSYKKSDLISIKKKSKNISDCLETCYEKVSITHSL